MLLAAATFAAACCWPLQHHLVVAVVMAVVALAGRVMGWVVVEEVGRGRAGVVAVVMAALVALVVGGQALQVGRVCMEVACVVVRVVVAEVALGAG